MGPLLISHITIWSFSNTCIYTFHKNKNYIKAHFLSFLLKTFAIPINCYLLVVAWMCAQSLVSDSVSPWTVTHQVPLSTEFSREEKWSGLPLLLQGIFPTQGLNPHLLLPVQFSCSVVSISSRPHGLQHPRPPCPSPTPGVYPNSCPSSRWCQPAISSSVNLFSSFR